MEKTVRKTGGHIDDLVFALIDAAYDKKPDVRDDMITALLNIGRKQPELVLSSCNVYLLKHPKLVQGHRVLLLDLMTKNIKDAALNISLDLSKEIISLASNELTKSKEIVPEWQTAASNVLVSLGVHFSQEVMAEMLQKIVPGTLPHYFVVLTLANLARENVFGVVPFLKDIFSRLLSMLGMAKADNMRWVLASCIGSFSEAILEYCANIENAPYPDIEKDRFFGEIFTAFELMFNVWLTGSKEARVRLAVVEAFGHMTHLMSKEKLEEHINRLLQGITSLYKRHTEHYIITQSFSMVLAAACADGSLMLLPHLDQILNGLHFQACTEPNYDSAQSIKNNNELLRCFQVLMQCYSDRIVGFLQQKLETGNEKSKSATISIIKHLINSSDPYLQNKKELLLSSFSIVLQDNNLKVCRSFAQCIIAMAHHDYLGLEGGQKMVEFIVRMCSLKEDEKQPKKTPETDLITANSVRLMCQNVLHLMSTTIDVMEDVLWPYLLEFILPAQYTDSLLAVCRALANIASQKREERDELFRISYSVSVNVPKPQALLSRLIVITGHPLKGGGRGIHILNFLKAYSPNIHESIVDMWDTVIPKLTVYLEENSYEAESWNQKAWEDLILKLLAKTLSEVDSEEWYLTFGRELGLQIPLYTELPDEKNFLYKCLGVVLRKIGTTDFIREHLNLIFSTVDHTNQTEREGCAVGVGFCAASHLDQCLMKLEEITKKQMVRKATGFMGLMKDKSEADVERIKSTVMLCYGYVVFYGPPSLICSRLEANVLRVINPHFASVRDSSVKQNLIRAVELIGRAIQPNHLQRDDYEFPRRVDLLKHMQNFLKAESKTTATETRSLAIDAITNLVKLQKSFDDVFMQEIITVCASNVYPVTINVTVQSPNRFKENQPIIDEDKAEKLINMAVDSLNNLMKELSSRDPNPITLQAMLKHLEQYLTSSQDAERERVISTVKVLLQDYLNVADFSSGIHFNTLGYILGRLLPRCFDPITSIRQNSMQCIQTLLTINDRYEGVPSNVKDERIQALSKLKETLSKSEPAVLFNVVNELSMVISKKTPDEQVKTLVFSICEGLKDSHCQSSSGACAILNCLMKFRGAELNKEVHMIVHEIVSSLSMVTFTQTITGSLVAMRTLATHHLIQVLQAFLDFSVPFNLTVCEFWKTLAKDKELTSDTLDHLLNLLNRTAPYNEVDNPKDVSQKYRYAVPLPVAISAALTEIFKVPETESLVCAMFPKLLSATLLRLGSCLNVKVAMETTHKVICFKEFISRTKYTSLQQYIDERDVWTLLEEESTFCDGMQVLVMALCHCQPSTINEVVSALLPSLSSPYDTQRLVPAAVFAELINQRCCGDMQLVELLMNSLLSKLVDPAHLVRRLCIRGLGNVASVGGQKLQTYSTTILSAMMAGMDDKEDPEMSITLEAMSGLSRILSLLDESSVRQILINICLRIRPCFEKENACVRAAAIELFGKLSRFGHGPSESSFVEQIHTNFVSMLLHLHEEQEVTKACKKALRLIAPRLESSAINDMFQKHLIEDGNLHYGEFMNDLSRLIIADYDDKMNFYIMGCVTFFKSNWDDIRANAVLFVGFLMGNLKQDGRSFISLDHVCSALVVLLKDPSATVRSRAAEAISLLYEY